PYATLLRTHRRPGDVRRFTEERHRDAGASQVPLPQETDHTATGEELLQAGERRGASPAVRDDGEAQALPVGQEALVERLRLEPLGDGGERAVPAGEPRPAAVPVRRVWEGDHGAA